MIYFAQSTDGGPVKIGFSDDVETRIRQLETHYGRPLAILATMPGGREEERAIHERFASLRFGRTEQFRPDPDLMAFIGRPLLVVSNPGTVEAMQARPSSALPAKLHTDVIESARIVTAFRGVTMTDLLSDILRPILAKMEGEEIAKRTKGRASK